MWYVCTLMFPIFLSQCFSEISHQELYDGLLFPSMPDGVYIPTQQSCLWHFGENHSGWCSATSEACIIAMVLVWFVLKRKLMFTGRRSYIIIHFKIWLHKDFYQIFAYSVHFISMFFPEWNIEILNLSSVNLEVINVIFFICIGHLLPIWIKKDIFNCELFLMQILEMKCYVLLHSMLFQCTYMIHGTYG